MPSLLAAASSGDDVGDGHGRVAARAAVGTGDVVVDVVAAVPAGVGHGEGRVEAEDAEAVVRRRDDDDDRAVVRGVVVGPDRADGRLRRRVVEVRDDVAREHGVGVGRAVVVEADDDDLVGLADADEVPRLRAVVDEAHVERGAAGPWRRDSLRPSLERRPAARGGRRAVDDGCLCAECESHPHRFRTKVREGRGRRTRRRGAAVGCSPTILN
jgi:hypothetical protein